MKQLTKQIGSIVIVFALILMQLLCVDAGAVTDDASLAGYKETLLNYLNVIERSSEDYGSDMTRGELAFVAAKVSNAAPYTEGELYFYDVPKDNKYYNEISALVLSGVLSGDGTGNYRPSDAVTFDEACKVFSVILGYDKVGEFLEFRSIAKSAGILDGVSVNATVSYVDGLRMAYNTLHCDMFEITALNQNNVTFDVNKGYMAIEHYHNIVMNEGLVEGANGSTLILPDDRIGEGQILINDKVFNYNDSSVLGKRVVFYCEKDDKEGLKEDIFYLYVDEKNNEIWSLLPENIISVKDGVLKYYDESDKIREMKLDDFVDVLVNGIAFPQYTEADIMPKEGRLTLINNDNDKNIDVISVEEIQYLVVEAFNAEEGIIYGRYPQITIGTKGRTIKVNVFRADGKKARTSSIGAGNVVAVKASKNLTETFHMDVYNLGNGAFGTVKGIDDESIKIDDKTYKLSKGVVFDSPIKIGESVGFYEHNGQCVAVLHGDNDTYKYGYLTNAANVGNPLKAQLGVHIIDTNLVAHSYQAVEKVKIDEIVRTDIDAILNGFIASSPDIAGETEARAEWPMAQLIRYRLNDQGLVTHIDTNVKSDNETEDSLRLDISTNEAGLNASLRYGYKNQTFYHKDTDEMIFSIPETGSKFMPPVRVNGDITKRNEVRAYVGDFDDYRVHNRVEAYNVDPDSLMAEFAVVYHDKMDYVAATSPLYIITSVSKELDEEGEVQTKIEHLNYVGATDFCFAADDLDLSQIEAGDVVRMTIANGECTAVEEWFDITTKEISGDNRIKAAGTYYNYNMSYSVRLTAGTVYTMEDSVITHTTSHKGDFGGGAQLRENLHNYIITSGTRFFVYDTTERDPQVRTTTYKEIVTYKMDNNVNDWTLMYTSSGNLRWGYIVK